MAFPPAHPGDPDPPAGSSEDTDPLALARRLIDQARGEEFANVELGPLPVLPVPGDESPLELAMQLMFKARVEEEAEAPSREDNPLDLAIRLLGTMSAEGDTADRLAVASQLLEVEEASRREKAPVGLPPPPPPPVEDYGWLNLPTVPDAAAAELWKPDQGTPLFPAPPEEEWAPETEAPVAQERWTPDQAAPLQPEPIAAPSPEIPALEALPELPPLSLPPELAPWSPDQSTPLRPEPEASLLPTLPTLSDPVEAAAMPDPTWAPDQSTPLLPASALPTLPPVTAREEAPAAELPTLPPEWGAIPTVPEPETLALLPRPAPEAPALSLEPDLPRLELPQIRLKQEAPANEPDQPRLELPSAREKADPSELARKLLQEAASEEKADPMALARRLLHDAEREEKSDPLALARRLLKDVQREEKPPAEAALMGAPVEGEAPKPLFDPAGLSLEQEQLLGAAEPWVDSGQVWPPPVSETFSPEIVPPLPPEVESTHAPPRTPPIIIPSATQVWPPPVEPAPRLELEKAEGIRQARALPLERDRPVEIAPAARVEPESRLALERAPGARVESTRDAGAYPTPPPVAQPSHTVPVRDTPVSVPREVVHRPAPIAPASPRSHRGQALIPVATSETFGKRIRKLWDRRARVEPNDVVIFTRQFSAMVNAGLQLHQALHFYAESHTESGLGEVIEDVATKVSQGSSLSAAMRNYPGVFPEVYSGLINAGETTGLLVSILSKLAELCERNQKLRQRVQAAITYPMVVLIVSLLCIGVFIWVVLPMFTPMFTSMGVELPWPTKVLVWISDVGRNPYLVAVVLLTPPLLWILSPWLRRLFSTPTRRRALDRFILRIPYFGNLVEKVVTARVLFSLASLLDAGIPFTTCLEKCESVAGNAEVAWRLKMARGLLVEGDTAADCLAAHGVFPHGAIQMIAVGEESAQLSEMIRRVASVYDDDVQLALMDLASMLEPIILLVMGVVVGFIVLASALPTASLLQTL